MHELETLSLLLNDGRLLIPCQLVVSPFLSQVLPAVLHSPSHPVLCASYTDLVGGGGGGGDHRCVHQQHE